MTNIIIRRNRVNASASVYLDGYPGTPSWNNRYRGPVWKPGDFNGIFALAKPYYPDTFFPDGSFSGFSSASVEQMGNTMIVLESTYDTLDPGTGTPIPGVTLKAYAHVSLDMLFLVKGGAASISFQGPGFQPGSGQELEFVVYNLTDGNVLVDSTFGDYNLFDGHVYRLRAHAHAEGYGDLTAAAPSLVQIGFMGADVHVHVPDIPEA